MSKDQKLEIHFNYKWPYPGKIYFVKNMEKIWILEFWILKDTIPT